MQITFLSQKFVTATAFLFLTAMAIFMVGSVWNDSAIMDELPHIPAGYSYLTQMDYRLNPEHPPLIKMLAALPLLFLDINFPHQSKHWTDDINGQWDFGRDFLYHAGNDADSILFWARVPIILLALVTGWLFFSYLRRRFSDKIALMTLGMYALSPVIIAHSRFVTTDLGATVGFLFGIFAFAEFLQNPNRKNMFIAGIALAVAFLLKFSLILLLPMYFLMFIGWIIAQSISDFSYIARLLGKCVGIFMIAIFIIWPVYQYAVWNYPPERQLNDAKFNLSSHAKGPSTIKESCISLSRIARCPAELTLWASDKPIIRPLAQYASGLLMVFQRAAGGNTAYFMGEVSAIGSRWYFPVAYLTKEAMPILIMLVLALWLAVRRVIKAGFSLNKTLNWPKTHWLEFSSLVAIIVYWAISIKSPLNIGVRHIMPVFPFMYILISAQIGRWLEDDKTREYGSFFGKIQEIFRVFFLRYVKFAFVAFLFLWLFFKMLIAFPDYLSYFNIFGKGTDNGYLLITDSNYDWGQDLKRLKYFVEKNKIEKIAVDYFGGGDPIYYLGDKFEPWWSAKGPARGWFAVSATFRQEAFGKTAPGFIRKPENEYGWLKTLEPVARAGKSIFIYQLP